MVRMRGIRVPALLVALVLAVAGCGSAAGKTETGAGSSGAPAQTVPDIYGITSGGDIAHFSDGTWTTQKPELSAGETIAQISWSGLRGTRPLATMRADVKNSCNPYIRRIDDDGTLSDPIGAGYSPSQSPDGKFLAYLSLGPASVAGDAPSKVAQCGEQRLIVKDMSTGTVRSWQVTYPAKAPNYRFGYIETALAWSPDSTHIVVGTQDAQLYSVDIANWAKGSTLRVAKDLRSGKRILDQIWNYATGHLFINGTGSGGDSVVLDRIDPTSGKTLGTIDTGQQSFPIGMFGSGDHSVFLDHHYQLGPEQNQLSIVEVAENGDKSVISSDVPDLVSAG